MEKHPIDNKSWGYPGPGDKISIPLAAVKRKEKFSLDISRGRINLLKGTYQNRARRVIVLARIDFGGAPHCNPDGEEIACPHLHRYRDGWGDKWAIPLPPEHFRDRNDMQNIFDGFLSFCNITKHPVIQWSLL